MRRILLFALICLTGVGQLMADPVTAYQTMQKAVDVEASNGSIVAYEYWFDDDVANRTVVSWSANDAVLRASISTEGLSPGIHKFNFRVRRSDGEYSPVTSSIFFKGATQGKKLEYWFDDDIGSRDHIDISDTEEEQTLDLNLCDINKFPLGFHKFNMRLAMGGYSPVYTAYVLKLSSGAPTKIEYWVDDDYDNRQWVTGHPSASGDNDYVYLDPFNLSEVSPGMHRIYYRATSENGITSSPVSMTPVFVKSKYGASSDSGGSVDAQVTQYSIVIDNEEPVTRKFGTPDYDVTLDDGFDVHDLTPGIHTMKVKFWNNLGAGVSHQAQFEKIVPEILAPTLTATEKDGIVQLHYDIPANQQAYRLMRKDANGAKAELYRRKTYRGYEESESYTDAPAAGSYTYYVESSYNDNNGSPYKLTSNEVSFTIAQAQSELNNCGYITGIIWPKYGAAPRHDIIYSDGVVKTIEDQYFERQMIPAGKELTISVKGNSIEEFETVTITIKPGENRVSLKDLSNPLTGETKPNYFTNDLQFSSDLEWVGSNYRFSVKNITRHTWSGYVRLRIIAKDKTLREKELAEGDGGEGIDPSEEENYDEITPGLRAEDNYIYVTSEEIKNLQPGYSTMLTLSLDNVFPPDKKDWYYIYFESIGKWDIDPDGLEKVKDIGIDYDYSITENPISRRIDKSSLVKAQEKVLMQDAEYAANVILAYCSKLSQFDGVIGNIPYIDWKLNAKGLEKYPREIQKLNRLLEYSAGTEMFVELIEDGEMQNFLSEVFTYEALDLASKYHDELVKDIIKYSGGAKEYLSEALKFVNYIRTFKSWEQMNEYDKFFNCADAIVEFAGRYDKTMGSILRTYSKVGKAFIQKALQYGAAYYNVTEADLLLENIPSEKDRPRYDYNRHVDFKIKVQTNKFVYFNFDHFGTEPILEVVVKAHNKVGSPNEVATFFFDLEPEWDGVMLRQISMDNGPIDKPYLSPSAPIDRMWMEIKWKNGRITKVPLRNDLNCVQFEGNPLGENTSQYTVYLKSNTTKFKNMADEIEIKE